VQRESCLPAQQAMKLSLSPVEQAAREEGEKAAKDDLSAGILKYAEGQVINIRFPYVFALYRERFTKLNQIFKHLFDNFKALRK
jgi:hypothetical protein